MNRLRRSGHPVIRRCLLVCVVLGLSCLDGPSSARADSWPSATAAEAFSESREWLVRIVPGGSGGDTVGFEGSPTGPYARAEWYRRDNGRSYRFLREVTLTNPVAPVKFLVTDRGYLATFDNWHNMGYGHVVVSYGPDGRKVAGYELKNLFSTDEIGAFRTSVSAIWWRTETVYVRQGQQSIYVALHAPGEELVFEPETGGWQYCAQGNGQHLCRSTNEDRVWQPYQEPATR